MPISSGILVYRHKNEQIEFLLLKPGGPFYKNKDEGSWTIPKGSSKEGEELIETALREFEEETGISLISSSLKYLGKFKTSKIKSVEVFFSCEAIDIAKLTSNQFEIEYPKNSGNFKSFSEIEKGEWFTLDNALEKIMSGQKQIVIHAAKRINESI